MLGWPLRNLRRDKKRLWCIFSVFNLASNAEPALLSLRIWKSCKILFYLFSPLLHFLNPFAGIHKSFYPGSDVILFTFFGIPGALPWKHCPFGVRHHGQMASILGTDSGSIERGTVRVGGIAGIAIFYGNQVLRFFIGELEFPFAMSYPSTQTHTFHILEHHAMVFLNRHVYEPRFKFV